MKFRKQLLIFLTTATCAVTAFGVGFAVENNKISTISASAQTKTIDDVTFEMDAGAAVRKDTPTGIRFRSMLSVDDYNALEANTAAYSRVTYGMLIAPVDYVLEYGALNEENVFGENPVYGWTDGTDTYGGSVQIVNVSRNQMTDYTDDNGNAWKNFTGVMHDVKGTNYHREFVGVGYIEAVDKEGNKDYRFATSNDNTRSVSYVAQKALLNGEADNGTALKGFVQYAYLNDIISDVTNAEEIRPVDYAKGIASFTASASDMYINLDGATLAEYGEYYDYMDITVHSSNAAEFRIFTTDTNDQQNAAYVYNTLTTETQTHRIPLNDTSIHDFSKHDLRLFAASAGQNITIDSISFVKEEEQESAPTPEVTPDLGETMMSSEGNFWNYFHFGEWGTNTWDGTSVNVTTNNFTVQKAFIDDALAQGYTHAKISVASASSDVASVVMITDGSLGWNYYWKSYNGNSADIRIDLSAYEGKEYSTLTIEFRNSAGETTSSDVSVTDVEFFKSEETTTWTKTSTSVYAAYENGKLVIDMVGAGGNPSGVSTSTEWWKQYAGACSNSAIRLYTEYLYRNNNSRAPLWGKNGSAVDVLYGDAAADSGSRWLNDQNYTDGDTFFFTADTESVYTVEMVEWVSTRNEWSGTSLERVDADTVQVTGLEGQYLWLSNYADYVAAGYTHVTINATYASGQLWAGNDVWGGSGYMHSVNSGEAKTLELAQMDKFCLYFSAATADAEITYTFETVETPDAPVVTLPSGTGYTVSGNGTYTEGSDYTFTVSVADGYDATTMHVLVNGVAVYPVNGTYTVSQPSGDLTITVHGVKAETYSVILPNSSAYTGAGEQIVNQGESATFTIIPTTDGATLTVKAGDTVLTANGNEYTVENVTANIILTVEVSIPEAEPTVPTLGETMMSSEDNFWNYFHFGTWGTNTWDGSSVNVTTSNFQIQKAFIDDALAQGYTHAKISVVSDSSDITSIVMLTDGSLGWNYYWKQYSGNSADVRIDLNTYKGKDYSTLTIEFRNSAGTGTSSSVTMTGIEFYTSEETTTWTKTNNSVYVAYENGMLIMDTVSAGGDSGVSTSTEWWKKYATFYTGAAPAIRMYSNYLNAGSNTRSALWGKNGSPVNTIHGNGLSAGWGWNNDLSYTDGDTFFLSADKECVLEFEILEWHSNCNEWSGTSIEKVDNDTIKVTSLAEQKLFLATYDDYVAAGYTEVTITATFTNGQVWAGNDVWTNGYMHGLNSGEAKTLELAKMEQLGLYFTEAMSDVEITYVFGGMVNYGIANYAIVIPDEDNGAISYAADELQYFVNEMVGETLPIVRQSEASAYEGRQIIIGSTQLSEVPQSASAFALKNIDGNLHIGGYDDRGILYGVYELLDIFGVKFLTATYTHIPNVDDLSVKIDTITEEPAFAYSAYYTGETMDTSRLDTVKYTSRLRFVHQFTGEGMDSVYYAPNNGNDELIYGEGGTLSTIEATQIRMDWFANGTVSSSHNSMAYAALGVYALRESISDWSEMIEFGYATDTWYWGNDSTPATVETTWGGYDAPNIKPLISGEIAYESLRLDTAYMTANYGGVLYSDGSDLCYSSGVLKDTDSAVTALSLVKAGMDYAMTNWGEGNTYFMLGYSDQETRCDCSTCAVTTSKSTISGTVEVYQYNKTYFYYKFVQAVANAMLTAHADKKVVMFAYSSSSGDVPSTGSLDGNWLTGYDPYIEAIPVDTIGQLPANVYLQWAPIWLDEAYALNDTTSTGARTEVAAQLAQWSAYVQNNQFMLWGYDNNYFIYMNTLGVLAENIEYAKQNGFTSYMVQASNSEDLVVEMSMKSYVLSKAVWYNGTVTDALITEWRNEFIKYYYGEAAYDYVVQYYDELNEAYASTFAEGYKTNDWSLGQHDTADMIPADTLLTLIGHLNNGIAAVGEDSVYAEHLNLLKFSPRYMYLMKYGDDTSGVAGTKAELKADMLAAGVQYVGENVTVESKLG
ncbi:MAG: DUF4838 domain-containing protein [Clostridia bacterium]|nr:DUF4838 domain-containing protein [Clostridia bacterium]